MGASTTYFLWDGDRLLAEYDGSGARTARYAYAAGFSPLQVGLSSGVYDVHADHLDTPRMLTDSGGVPRWRAAYEAFGKASIDPNPDGDGNPGQHFAETGPLQLVGMPRPSWTEVTR